jgi:hypothetical protein
VAPRVKAESSSPPRRLASGMRRASGSTKRLPFAQHPPDQAFFSICRNDHRHARALPHGSASPDEQERHTREREYRIQSIAHHPRGARRPARSPT